MKILVADRNLRMAQSLCALLRNKGHETFAAATAEEMLGLARAERPYFIVLDTDLPDLPDLLPFYHIRNMPEVRDSVVLLLSARPSDEKVIWGFCLHSDGHWNRPVNVPELLHFVQILDENYNETPRFGDRDFSRFDKMPQLAPEN